VLEPRIGLQGRDDGRTAVCDEMQPPQRGRAQQVDLDGPERDRDPPQRV
jgi:hypothetical protein